MPVEQMNLETASKQVQNIYTFNYSLSFKNKYAYITSVFRLISELIDCLYIIISLSHDVEFTAFSCVLKENCTRNVQLMCCWRFK